MEIEQTIDAGLIEFELPRVSPTKVILDLLQPLTCYMTIVGQAKNVLHGLDRRIELGAKARGEAGYEDFHGIAQVLAVDADLMQVLVIVQVLRRRLMELCQQVAQARSRQDLLSK